MGRTDLAQLSEEELFHPQGPCRTATPNRSTGRCSMRRLLVSLTIAGLAILATARPIGSQTGAAQQTSTEQRQSLADNEFAHDSYKTAETLYRRVLAVQPENVHALSRLALLLTWRGEYKEAIDLYNKAL